MQGSQRERAQRRLDQVGVEGVEVLSTDALVDYQPRESFDAIVITGSTAEVPERVRQWVRPNGCLFAVRGFSPAMEAIRMTRTDADHWQVDSLFDTDLPRLIGAEDQPQFEF